jgi:hypothetical protein
MLRFQQTEALTSGLPKPTIAATATAEAGAENAAPSAETPPVPPCRLSNGQARLPGAPVEHTAVCPHRLRKGGSGGNVSGTAATRQQKIIPPEGWPFLAFPDPFTTKVTTTV